MKVKELRQKSAQELKDELIALQRQHFNLRIQHGTGELKAPHMLRIVRRNIARIKTLLGEMT